MNYYSHNIGDFAVETKYMTFEQKGLYIDMVDRYLSTGKPLDSHWVSTIKRLASEGAVDAVLMLCFEERDGLFYSERCEKIIADYEAMAEKNRRNAQKRAKKAVVAEGKEPTGECESLFSQPSGNPVATQSPLTNNHKPITNNHKEEKKETKKVDSRGSRLNVAELPADWREFAEQEEPELDPRRLFENFKDYWNGLSGAKAIKKDWKLTWRNFVRSFHNAEDWKRRPMLKNAPSAFASSKPGRFVEKKQSERNYYDWGDV